MNEAIELYRTLAALGVRLQLKEGKLLVDAPVGVLTVEWQQRIRDGRAALIECLQVADRARSGAVVAAGAEGDKLAFPLSDIQLGFFVADDPYMEFHVRPHCYMEFDHLRFEEEAYEVAWNTVLRRHRRELCVVGPDADLHLLETFEPVKITIHDLRGYDSLGAASALASIRAGMARQELPLDRWPWLDLRISLRHEGGRVVRRLHYNHNNFFIDGWGTSALLAEVDRCCEKPELALEPLQISYRDAVLALDRQAASESGKNAERYWFSRLPALPRPPAIPIKEGLNKRRRAYLDRREATLSATEWNQFKLRAAEHGVTPSNAVICAYAHILATWSNSDHFILSQMTTRRMAELHPEMMQLLGNFVSLYPLEIRIRPECDFASNARHVQQQVLQDLDHLQIGGMRVLQELNRQCGSFGGAPSPFVVGSGLSLKQWRRADFTVLETCQTLLDHQFFELDDGSCWLVWDLLEEFFPDGLIAQMLDAYTRFLHRLAADDATWLSTRHRFLEAPDADAPASVESRSPLPQSAERLHTALERAATRTPDAVMLHTPACEMTCAQVWHKAAALSDSLRSRGVGPGERVAIVMNREADLLVAVFAVLRAGAAYVPIDPQLPAARVRLLLEDVAPAAVLTTTPYRHTLPWSDVISLSDDMPERAPASPLENPDVDPGAMAYVIYTSGSTGRPKGVMVSHRAAMNTIVDVNRRFGVTASDVLFGVSAFNFDLSVYDIFGSIDAGARLVFPDPASSLDPDHWLALVREQRVTVWNSVPALMQLLVDAAQRSGTSLPSLTRVFLSGDKIPLELPAQIRHIAPNAEVVSLGGATEAAIWSIYYEIGDIDPTWRTIPYGYPLANQGWRVLDRHGNRCPDWVPGELHISGMGLADGYWNDPARTEQRFVHAADGERLYKTGDEGRSLGDGCIEWIGRTDLQVKIQGHRVELGEIEATLMQKDDVKNAVVTAAGHGTARHLVGHLLVESAAETQTAGVETFLRTRLPGYMIPSRWLHWKAWPLTANGKVDRNEIARAGETSVHAGARAPKRAPTTALEKSMCSLWAQALGLGEVGLDDDFFELGGQSFDAIRLFARVKDLYGRRFTLSDMWQLRTADAFVRALAQGSDGAAENLLIRLNDHTAGVPLILIHPAGGSALAYAPLARSLSRPVFGINAAQRASALDIRSLAAEYLARVESAVDAKRIGIGGWSTGAMIAVEMAARWCRHGGEIERVYVLDGPVPAPLPHCSDELILSWYMQDIGVQLPVDVLRDANLSGLEPPAQLKRAVGLLQTDHTLDAEALATSFVTFGQMVRAGAQHDPTPLDADITVVRVEQDIVDEFAQHPMRAEPDWGWRSFVTGQVHCIRVAGNHNTFLREPDLVHWSSVLESHQE